MRHWYEGDIYNWHKDIVPVLPRVVSLPVHVYSVSRLLAMVDRKFVTIVDLVLVTVATIARNF